MKFLKLILGNELVFIAGHQRCFVCVMFEKSGSFYLLLLKWPLHDYYANVWLWLIDTPIVLSFLHQNSCFPRQLIDFEFRIIYSISIVTSYVCFISHIVQCSGLGGGAAWLIAHCSYSSKPLNGYLCKWDTFNLKGDDTYLDSILQLSTINNSILWELS